MVLRRLGRKEAWEARRQRERTAVRLEIMAEQLETAAAELSGMVEELRRERRAREAMGSGAEQEPGTQRGERRDV